MTTINIFCTDTASIAIPMGRGEAGWVAATIASLGTEGTRRVRMSMQDCLLELSGLDGGGLRLEVTEHEGGRTGEIELGANDAERLHRWMVELQREQDDSDAYVAELDAWAAAHPELASAR